jgi:uncharacterized protein (TIGR02145 family)
MHKLINIFTFLIIGLQCLSQKVERKLSLAEEKSFIKIISNCYNARATVGSAGDGAVIYNGNVIETSGSGMICIFNKPNYNELSYNIKIKISNTYEDNNVGKLSNGRVETTDFRNYIFRFEWNNNINTNGSLSADFVIEYDTEDIKGNGKILLIGDQWKILDQQNYFRESRESINKFINTKFAGTKEYKDFLIKKQEQKRQDFIQDSIRTLNKKIEDSILISHFNSTLVYDTVKDIEGNTYRTIQIGEQIWMAENLRVSSYQNGIPINKKVEDRSLWKSAANTTPEWYYYKNNSYYNTTHGKLYNWYAVINLRNICPVGWHVPTKNEWMQLVDYLGGVNTAAKKLKTGASLYWAGSGFNTSGFSALPSGYRNFDGEFKEINESSYYWTSSGENNLFAHLFSLFNWGMDKFFLNKSNAYSVRCVKN